MAQVELMINGKKIPLTEFPRDFIQHTIFGMVKSLKGVDEQIESLSLTIENKEE
jgi:hypothetical protein